ncbi:adenosine deaminase [Candidatus Woesearchaeota archaeon]|nr:adenosine deaminase [Candidatus Woesearchaeota archaeon]
MLTKEEIRQLPKIDLHRHLDGDVRTETLSQLAQQEKRALPPEGLDAYFCDARKQGLVALLQKGFGLVTSLMQSEENLYTVAFEEVRNLKDDGIVYAEIRFAPQYHTGDSQYYGHSARNALDYRTIIRAVSQGLRDGEEEFGVWTNLIVCIGREADPQKGVEIVHAASGENVVAIDLACDEASYPPERHLIAYQETFNTPLKRTVHAGEFGSQQYHNMMTALTLMRANRLGHAIPLAYHPDALDWAVQYGIGIEMCPLSNRYCGFISSYEDLHLNDLLAAGVRLSINSDDPAMFGYTLTDVLYDVMQEGSLTEQDLYQTQHHAIETAFLQPEEKVAMRRICSKVLR